MKKLFVVLLVAIFVISSIGIANAKTVNYAIDDNEITLWCHSGDMVIIPGSTSDASVNCNSGVNLPGMVIPCSSQLSFIPIEKNKVKLICDGDLVTSSQNVIRMFDYYLPIVSR